MKWKDIREEYPDSWILLESIEAHSDQGKRVVDKIEERKWLGVRV